MSSLLFRWGRWSARHPWPALGAWLLASVLVLAASAGVGRTLEDTMAAPGTDSQAATDLLAGAGGDRAGMTAYVVATPRQSAVTFGDPSARADLAALRDRVAAASAVVEADEQVSPDGRVALVTLQYPPIEELGRDRPRLAQERRGRCRRRLVAAGRGRRRPLLQLRGLPDQRRRGARAGRRPGHPAVRVRVAARGRAAGGDRARWAARRRQPAAAGRPPDRHPPLGAGDGRDGRARGRHRLRAAAAHPVPRAAGRRRGRARRRGSSRGDRRPVGPLRRRHRRRGDPRPGVRGPSLRRGRRGRHRHRRARDGARGAHPVAGPPRPGRRPDHPTRPRRPAPGPPARSAYGGRGHRPPLGALGPPRDAACHRLPRSAEPRSSSRWRCRCSGCGWACPTRGACRSRAPSEGPTT